MKILVMTGNRLRHLYFAIEIARRIPNVQIIIENFHPETGRNYSNNDVTSLMAEHFEGFDKTEKQFFEHLVNTQRGFLENCLIKKIEPGTVNDIENVNFIKDQQADLILVYSTSIIKAGILDHYQGRIINLHAGLSPYYRGAGTNLFPFLNKELEFVGMTVHYLDAGIDSGDILLQGRPQFEEKDDTHTIGCKCVHLGVDLMEKVVLMWQKKTSFFTAKKQNLEEGRLYLKKHFTDEVIYKIRENINAGLVKQYLEKPREIDFVCW